VAPPDPEAPTIPPPARPEPSEPIQEVAPAHPVRTPQHVAIAEPEPGHGSSGRGPLIGLAVLMALIAGAAVVFVALPVEEPEPVNPVVEVPAPRPEPAGEDAVPPEQIVGLVRTIQSEPAGAEVLRDGVAVGQTPFELAFIDGDTVELEVRAEGYGRRALERRRPERRAGRGGAPTGARGGGATPTARSTGGHTHDGARRARDAGVAGHGASASPPRQRSPRRHGGLRRRAGRVARNPARRCYARPVRRLSPVLAGLVSLAACGETAPASPGPAPSLGSADEPADDVVHDPVEERAEGLRTVEAVGDSEAPVADGGRTHAGYAWRSKARSTARAVIAIWVRVGFCQPEEGQQAPSVT